MYLTHCVLTDLGFQEIHNPNSEDLSLKKLCLEAWTIIIRKIEKLWEWDFWNWHNANCMEWRGLTLIFHYLIFHYSIVIINSIIVIITIIAVQFTYGSPAGWLADKDSVEYGQIGASMNPLSQLGENVIYSKSPQSKFWLTKWRKKQTMWRPVPHSTLTQQLSK